MAKEHAPSDVPLPATAAPQPLCADHWQKVIAAMGLSEQHARVVELVLRDFTNKQIAAALNLGEGTVKDYLQRIAQRTGTRGRMQLAMHVLAVCQRCRER